MLKIISDGTSVGTKVTYDGVELKQVSKVEIKIAADESTASALVTFLKPELNILAPKIEEELVNVGNK